MENIKRDLRAELDDFLKKNNVSLTVFAKRYLGKSVTLLSQWKSGKHKKPAQLDLAIAAILDRELDRDHDGGDEIPFIQTTVSKRIGGTASICRKKRKICALYGEPGYGKTRSIKEWASTLPDVLLFESHRRYTTKNMMSDIHKAVCEGGQGTINSMFLDIVKTLKGSGRMIIVDEAENLPVDAIDYLRRIWDMARVGVLLIGLPKLIANMSGRRGEYDYISSRIYMRVKIDKISLDDCREFLQAVMPKARPELAKKLYEKGRGIARHIENIAVRSKEICEYNGNVPLDEEILEAAAREQMI